MFQELTILFVDYIVFISLSPVYSFLLVVLLFNRTFKRSWYINEDKAKLIPSIHPPCVFWVFLVVLRGDSLDKGVWNTDWKFKFSVDLLYPYSVTDWEFIISLYQFYQFYRLNFIYQLNLHLFLWGRVYRNFWGDNLLDSL